MTENLRKEHILPFGLSGSAILPKSSCGGCAKITARLEQMVLRGPMWPVRVFRDLKSRTKHQYAPKNLPLVVIRNGQDVIVDHPIEDFPIVLMFPVFAPPALLFPEGYQQGIVLWGLATVRFGPPAEEVAARLGASQIRIEQEYRVAEFARMIAKIAYAFAFAEGAVDSLDGSATVIPAILGERNDIGLWVGTLTKPCESHPGDLHRLILHRDHEKGLLIVEVQLFSDSETPSYCVILGRLKSKR